MAVISPKPGIFRLPGWALTTSPHRPLFPRLVASFFWTFKKVRTYFADGPRLLLRVAEILNRMNPASIFSRRLNLVKSRCQLIGQYPSKCIVSIVTYHTFTLSSYDFWNFYQRRNRTTFLLVGRCKIVTSAKMKLFREANSYLLFVQRIFCAL